MYDAACAAIAEALIPDGFRYLKSKHALDRTIDAFVHRVSFQSSQDNIAGQSVLMWMHANVRCKELAMWRSKQPNPLRTDDWVAGGMVHLLTQEHAMIEWQIADPTSRSATIADAQNFTKTVVLGYFALFEDPQEACAPARFRRDLPQQLGRVRPSLDRSLRQILRESNAPSNDAVHQVGQAARRALERVDGEQTLMSTT